MSDLRAKVHLFWLTNNKKRWKNAYTGRSAHANQPRFLLKMNFVFSLFHSEVFLWRM